MQFQIEFKKNTELSLVRVEHSSPYATGSCPCNSPEEVFQKVEELLGKGSYLAYHKENGSYVGLSSPHVGELPYFISAVKTKVLEEALLACQDVWGLHSVPTISEWKAKGHTMV
jgi:hypothetical protein